MRRSIPSRLLQWHLSTDLTEIVFTLGVAESIRNAFTGLFVDTLTPSIRAPSNVTVASAVMLRELKWAVLSRPLAIIPPAQFAPVTRNPRIDWSTCVRRLSECGQQKCEGKDQQAIQQCSFHRFGLLTDESMLGHEITGIHVEPVIVENHPWSITQSRDSRSAHGNEPSRC